MLTSSKAVSSTVAPAMRARASLGKPWSASNANKPASSWLPKQDPKNQWKHGGQKGTSTVDKKERARGQESKRAREQEGKREGEDVKM